MFLQQLPDPVRWVLLFAVGALLGGFANLAIYELSWYRRRKISPWSKVDADQPKRSWLDRIPIAGWWFLKRESDQYGKGFWVRPLLIELAIACFLVWFYEWLFSGGLFGNQLAELEPGQRRHRCLDIVGLDLVLFLFRACTTADDKHVYRL